MDAIYIVAVSLANLKGDDAPPSAYRWAFRHQPNSLDVLAAFDADPLCSKLEDHAGQRLLLKDGLDTWGVPRIGKMHQTDEQGYHIAQPMVAASWVFNAIGSNHAEVGVPYGSISVQFKQVQDNKPEAVQVSKPQKKGRK